MTGARSRTQHLGYGMAGATREVQGGGRDIAGAAWEMLYDERMGSGATYWGGGTGAT